jgi:competence ComEA-like helix-hairpin-helix protein
MTRPRVSGFDFRWTRRNLAALIALCLLAAAFLGSRGLRRGVELGEPIAVLPQRVRMGTERINPNTATVASFRRLPGIGAKTAEKIVAYRRRNPDLPFRTPADLTNVKGIGVKTVQRIRPFLQMTGDVGSATTVR